MENNQQMQPVRVIVVGAGYAGLLATVRLAGRTRSNHKGSQRPVHITLVNESEMFVERPRLHQFAANEHIERRPIENVLSGTGVEFVQGYASQIDAPRRALVVQTDKGTQQIKYDYLLYALGSTTNRDAVPGVREYAYTLAPRGPLSAVELRERLPQVNEAGGTVVVCGGGATGIESAAEFASAYPNLSVQLITRGSLGQQWGAPVATYIRKSLDKLGVTIHEHTTVTGVGPGEIQAVGEQGAVSYRYEACLWTGGFVAPPLAREAGLAVNERGQVLVDPFMRSISHPEVFAIGDAAYPLQEGGIRVRMSALTAAITGAHGADTLSAVLHGKDPKPLSFVYLGQGIALGRHNAIGFNNFPDDIPRGPYFTGRFGFEGREFFLRILASAARYERRRPGLFFWLGGGRYAASSRAKAEASA